MRLLKLNLTIAVGLCAVSASEPSSAHAQETGAQDTGAQESQRDRSERASQRPSRENQPTAATLDDLIPQSAVDAAQEWAEQGVEALPDTEADPGPVLLPPPAPDTSETEFTIPPLEQLGPSEEAEALAEIDAPDLVPLPALEEFQVSDAITLAFPQDRSLFPERAEFINRFRALSTVRSLGGGEGTIPQIAARARADQELLVQMLRTYGYYNGEVARQLSGGRREQNGDAQEVDTDPRVRFDILPGERYSFGQIDLGALDYALDYFDLVDAFAIKAGDPLYADRIVDQEQALRLALGETGYPFALIDPPDLLVDHATQQGDLTLFVDPGEKYVFGGIVSEDEGFLSAKHLSRIARFQTGDTFQASLQADLRRAILATGLVSSVAVTPREITPADGDTPGEVALDVAFEQAPLRTIAGAIGYGTEDGLKLEASWEHRNLFPSEGSLKLRGIIGTREQLASVTFKKNNFRGRDQVLTVDAYASDIVTEAVDARTIALRGSFEKVSNLLFQKPLSWQVGVEALHSDERNRVISGIPRPRQTYDIFGLFGGATLDTSDDLLDPSQGYRLTGFVAPEISNSLGQSTFYLRNQLDASYYSSFGSNVIAGRVRGATIQGADLGEIAPSRRLYAGGGGSVRGYGFQGVGPRNDLGEATGGRSLVEVAVEARIETGLLDGAVEIVPFVDAGSVSLDPVPDFRFVRYGAGVGVRYKTTFGPIRVDVATPLNPTEFDAPVVVYVSLGQAF